MVKNFILSITLILYVNVFNAKLSFVSGHYSDSIEELESHNFFRVLRSDGIDSIIKFRLYDYVYIDDLGFPNSRRIIWGFVFVKNDSTFLKSYYKNGLDVKLYNTSFIQKTNLYWITIEQIMKKNDNRSNINQSSFPYWEIDLMKYSLDKESFSYRQNYHKNQLGYKNIKDNKKSVEVSEQLRREFGLILIKEMMRIHSTNVDWLNKISSP